MNNSTLYGENIKNNTNANKIKIAFCPTASYSAIGFSDTRRLTWEPTEKRRGLGNGIEGRCSAFGGKLKDIPTPTHKKENTPTSDPPRPPNPQEMHGAPQSFAAQRMRAATTPCQIAPL
jgi:hypothetical protein